MADIGYVALALALAASIYSAIAFLIGAKKGYPVLVASARNGALVVFGLISLAALALFYALVTHDFQLEYVYSHTSRNLPLIYLISAFWAGNEGSLLFWAWMISLFTAIIVLRKSDSNDELVPYASSVALITQAFFLIVLVFLPVANPFDKLGSTPPDGSGLNPLLENIGMIVHPPALLGGYAAFTIPFAFAIAALITGNLGNEWINRIRGWTLIAWLLLGIGNILGMWWAYVELGWGGYWAWDPVENSSLMPWLIGTAFLHSLMMQRQRGMFKVWNMVLIIMAFNLCIFGTYLTRSDIISSVHTFQSSILGWFFLTFLLISLFISLGLVFYRWKAMESDREMDSLVSKESSFLLNNIIMVAATLTIFLGTMYPLISRNLFGTETTPGVDFFNRIVGPIFLALILLIGVCVFLNWGRASKRNFIRSFLYPLIVALITCIILFLAGIREWYALTLFPLCAFVACTHLFAWYRDLIARSHSNIRNIPEAFFGLIWGNRSRYGGMIVHLGIVLIALGTIGSSFYNAETQVQIQPGESISIRGYTLTFDNMSSQVSTDKIQYFANFSIYKGDNLVGKLTSERYFTNTIALYTSRATEVGIRTTPLDDVYVGLSYTTMDDILSRLQQSHKEQFSMEDLYSFLGDQNNTSPAYFNALVNPLVVWVWIGGWVFLAGGVIAFWPAMKKNKEDEFENAAEAEESHQD